MREYWLVDPLKNRIRVYRRGAEGSFPLVLDLSRETGGVLTTPVLPGLSVEVAEVLAESA
ncbi:MAG: Uma2 family endonuclease [Acidobacteria bacterium]|nr:Uma2 family endonuclease [Acidobacteriota bacterium]